jgi:hypothetical protein
MKNYDLGILKSQCGGDVSFFNEMIDLLIKTSSAEITNMEEAFLRFDLEKLAYYAHKVLSPYRQIQANELCALLQEVEVKAENKELTPERGQFLMEQIRSETLEIVKGLGSEYIRLSQ